MQYWGIFMEYDEERGTWNVIADGEWYFEGTYEQCCEVMDNLFCEQDDDYYEEEYDMDYYNDPEIQYGWAQQDTIDMYRRER